MLPRFHVGIPLKPGQRTLHGAAIRLESFFLMASAAGNQCERGSVNQDTARISLHGGDRPARATITAGKRCRRNHGSGKSGHVPVFARHVFPWHQGLSGCPQPITAAIRICPAEPRRCAVRQVNDHLRAKADRWPSVACRCCVQKVLPTRPKPADRRGARTRRPGG